MFKDIDVNDYDFHFCLQKSQFFKDCLYPEIDFQLKNGSVSVYKQLDSGISEEISVDELIYFIHYGIAKNISHIGADRTFRNCSSIGSIRNHVENMKILLKYGGKEEEEEEEEEVEEGPIMVMKEVSTKNLGSCADEDASNDSTFITLENVLKEIEVRYRRNIKIPQTFFSDIRRIILRYQRPPLKKVHPPPQDDSPQ
jgi:hypothetical protein